VRSPFKVNFICKLSVVTFSIYKVVAKQLSVRKWVQKEIVSNVDIKCILSNVIYIVLLAKIFSESK
jgi:hypothetical protein